MKKRSKYILEYSLRASPRLLYEFLSTPFGLVRWFAERVDEKDDRMTFFWNGSESKAKIVEKKALEFIRFAWEDSHPSEFLEFRISKNEITGDTALIITAFTTEKEKEEEIRLWNSQVTMLTESMGA